MSQTYKVFYFEDDTEVAEPIKKFLKEPVHGPALEVIHFADVTRAQNAIDKWSAAKPPDVALLDRHQYGYTNAGIDICKKIKKQWPQTPVVFLSDYAGIRDQYDGYNAQATVYLSKAMLLNEPNHQELIQEVLVAQIKNTVGDTPKYVNGSLEVNVEPPPALRWRGKELTTLRPDNIAIVDELAKPKRKGEARTYLTLAIAGDLRGDDDHIRENLRQRIQSIREAFQEVDEDFPQACKDKRHGIIAVAGIGYRWQSDVPDGDR